MGTDDTRAPFPLVDEILHATARYLGALTVLDEAALAAPSVLPGWTRAHVVAHLSRNADAFARVLRHAAAGEPASMYDSATARDHDIDETVATHDATALLDDATASAGRFEKAAAAYDGPLDATYTRLAGGNPPIPLTAVATSRRTEVEVHHADLGLDYRPVEWPADFSHRLVSRRMDELGLDGPSMVLSSTDEGSTGGLWKLGTGPGPEISGAVGDLAWWLVGRGGGAGLVSSTGELPTIPRWR